ncbi:MAG TPA: amylo-alpha-1,6-glucosidase [Xanthobacteraceae bacterium]|jgi:glycogen debranching enzyme|nr:amylo-alpha-1,6-glucosidase [Xanthobacteraceae bacterium]
MASVARPLDVPIDANSEVPFYIPATGPATRPRRTLKYGDTFIVLDSHGDIGASAGGTDGLFHADTRYLSRLELLLNGLQPLLLGSNLRDDNAWLTVDQTNPDFYRDDRIILEKDTVHVVRTIFLWRATAYQRLAIRNYGDRPLNLRLTIMFDADFADLFEVRGLHRERRGSTERSVIGRDRTLWTYHALDGKPRLTTLTFDPPPTELAVNSASYHLELAPGQTNPIFLAVTCDQPIEPRPVPFFRGLRAARGELRAATRNATTVETSNEILNETLCRSMADLHMLMTDTPQGRCPYAGIPWYSTTFGRDSLITALQMLWFEPSVARGVLRRLAHFQAKHDDPFADAQPGKILHEMRCGEMATLREVPFGLYYGSVDATPLFVLLAGLYLERTGDEDTVRELWPAIEAALRWIDGPGDPDQDGFVEYLRASEQGLANQGWKDSCDAIFHADGCPAEGRIALAEVQGYVFAGKRLAARCARRLGKRELAQRLDAEATRLAERFDGAFWCADLGTYALALDGRKEPCRVRSSNAGQVLFTGIARQERAMEVAEGLLRPEFFSGWGIRTVAKAEARYNPMSYHNGSIWPHDNALIALGFARYDRKQEIEQVFTGLFDAASYLDLRRLPELFCGFQRSRGRGPTLYPVACSPQAWASATPFTLLEASLGLEFDIGAGEIRLRNPRLPAFLQEVVLRNLGLGRSNVDLRVSRRNKGASVEILRGQGDIQISVILSQ